MALTLILVGVVVLPLIALFFYAVHRVKLGRFKLSASVSRLLSITIEIEADKPGNPSASEAEVGRELLP